MMQNKIDEREGGSDENCSPEQSLDKVPQAGPWVGSLTEPLMDAIWIPFHLPRALKEFEILNQHRTDTRPVMAPAGQSLVFIEMS